jgi:hypothetical protein
MTQRIEHPFLTEIKTPPTVDPEIFTDAGAAVAALQKLYDRNTAFLRDAFEKLRAVRSRRSATVLIIRKSACPHPALRMWTRAWPMATSRRPAIIPRTSRGLICSIII